MNSTKPLVSISCITYNHAKYIRDALEGFLMQKTTFPIEILIHDDASTDGTTEIVREYEEKNPDIIKPLYETKNQWNKGIRGSAVFNFPRARGKYIALCEGDDYWTDPFKLQKQVDLLEAHPECSMAVAKTDVYCLKNGQFHYQRTYEGVDKDLVYFDDLFNGCYFHTSTYVIPKINVISIEKYRDKIFLGDTALRFILIDIGPFVFLRETVSVYRIHGAGMWTKLNSYEQAVAHIKLFEALDTHFKPKYKKYWGALLVQCYIMKIFAGIKERQIDNLPQNIVRLAYLGLRYAPLVLKLIFSRLARFVQRKMINSGYGQYLGQKGRSLTRAFFEIR